MGNLSNIMIVREGTDILGIDQQIYLIGEGPGRHAYLQSVAKLVRDTRPDGNRNAVIGSFRQAFMDNFAVEISDEFCLSLIGGMHEGFQRIGDAFRNGTLTKCLEDGIARCFDSFIVDGQVEDKLPNLTIVDAMADFVKASASAISENLE